MSPETLMRAYNMCRYYEVIYQDDPEFARYCSTKLIVKWSRLGKKLEARILKYASAGHAARTRYLHTRGYMKIKGMG